jgi:hypothetical protein
MNSQLLLACHAVRTSPTESEYSVKKSSRGPGDKAWAWVMVDQSLLCWVLWFFCSRMISLD